MMKDETLSGRLTSIEKQARVQNITITNLL